MRLKALHGFCIGGGVDVAPDQEFEAPNNLAAQWVASGAAILAPERDSPVRVPVEMDGTDDASGNPVEPDAPAPAVEGSTVPDAPALAVEGSTVPDAPALAVTTSAPKGQKGK